VKGEPLRFVNGHNRREWPSRMIDALCGLKRHGHSFEEAWMIAELANPPSERDRGETVPFLWRDELSLREFTRDVAWAAWHDFESEEPGQGRALRSFSPALLVGLADGSGPAARGMVRAA